MKWRLYIDYDRSLYFAQEIDSPKHMDRILEKKLNKRVSGSGMGFWKGAGRDISFSYRTEKLAKEAKRKVVRMKGVRACVVLVE